MARHLLGVLEPSVILQINRDACRPPGVTSDGSEKTRRLSPLPNRSPGIVSVKSPPGQGCSSRINALEQGLPALKACDHNVVVQYPLEAGDAQAYHAPCRLFRGVLADGARRYDSNRRL